MMFEKLWGSHNGPRTDADIRAEIHEALRSYAPLDTTKPPFRVEVINGVAILRGVVRGAGQRDMAGQLAATVDGVEAVRNELRDDPTIEGAVAQALATHPRVHLLTNVIRIKSYHGVVTLRGPVLSQAQRLAAEVVARSVPGVIDVVNRLVAITNGNGRPR